MDPETARIVLAAILAIGAIVWLTGLQFLTGSHRAVKGQQPGEGILPELSVPVSKNWLAGSAEVDGQAKVLAARVASILAKGSPFGPVKIVEKGDEGIIFKRLGTGMANQSAGRWFQRGELRFTTVGHGQCRIEWTAELSSMSWLLWLGGLFQVLGLIALVAGGWVIYTYVASSPNPATRWQTLQMLQAVHLLWPPFLFGTLYRRGVRENGGSVGSLGA